MVVDLRKTSTLRRLQETQLRLDQRHSQQNQTAHAVAFLETLQAVDNPQGIAVRRQIFESIHLMVVYRSPEKVRLFLFTSQ
jgi:hypothetical protein